MLFIIVSHAKDDLKKSIYDQTSVIIKTQGYEDSWSPKGKCFDL